MLTKLSGKLIPIVYIICIYYLQDVKTDFTEQTVRINVVNVRLTLSVTGITVHVMMDVRFGGLTQNVTHTYVCIIIIYDRLLTYIC